MQNDSRTTDDLRVKSRTREGMRPRHLARLIFAGVIFGLLALTVAACGGSSSSGTGSSKAAGSSGGIASTANSSGPNPACKKTPVRGGSLVYARGIETASLNPWKVKSGNGDIFSDEMIYSPLVRLNPEGGDEIQPAVAESWEISKDGKTYVFHLRRGLKFSDGTPVTAEDVKWSLDNNASEKVDVEMSSVAAGYKSTTIVDPQTVRVELSEPIAAFLYDLAIFPAMILPKKEVQAQGEAFWKHPAGAGPFKVKEYATGDHLTLERNPYYWEQGKPYLESLRFDFQSEGNSRILALESGKAQIADEIPYNQIASLATNPKLKLHVAPVPSWSNLLLNNKVKPLGELDVRTAIQYAINRKLINSAIFKGIGEMPNSLFAPMKYYDKSLPAYEYDVAKAKEYMAKSNYPHGFSTTLIYVAGSAPSKPLTLLLQQELGEIGIKVNLKEVPLAQAGEAWTNMKYEMFIPSGSVSSDLPVPDEYAGRFADPSPGQEAFYTGWQDPTVSKKVHTFQRTLSEGSRAEQWAVIQREFREQNPSIDILNTPFVSAHGVGVCGTSINAMGVDRLENTWLAGEGKAS